MLERRVFLCGMPLDQACLKKPPCSRAVGMVAAEVLSCAVVGPFPHRGSVSFSSILLAGQFVSCTRRLALAALLRTLPMQPRKGSLLAVTEHWPGLPGLGFAFSLAFLTAVQATYVLGGHLFSVVSPAFVILPEAPPLPANFACRGLSRRSLLLWSSPRSEASVGTFPSPCPSPVPLRTAKGHAGHALPTMAQGTRGALCMGRLHVPQVPGGAHSGEATGCRGSPHLALRSAGGPVHCLPGMLVLPGD